MTRRSLDVRLLATPFIFFTNTVSFVGISSLLFLPKLCSFTGNRIPGSFKNACSFTQDENTCFFVAIGFFILTVGRV